MVVLLSNNGLLEVTKYEHQAKDEWWSNAPPNRTTRVSPQLPCRWTLALVEEVYSLLRGTARKIADKIKCVSSAGDDAHWLTQVAARALSVNTSVTVKRTLRSHEAQTSWQALFIDVKSLSARATHTRTLPNRFAGAGVNQFYECFVVSFSLSIALSIVQRIL